MCQCTSSWGGRHCNISKYKVCGLLRNLLIYTFAMFCCLDWLYPLLLDSVQQDVVLLVRMVECVIPTTSVHVLQNGVETIASNVSRLLHVRATYSD